MTSLLLTGAPGCGKTTLIRSVLAQLHCPAGGFYTQEVRQNGVRRGFEVVVLDGRRGRLAEVGLAAKFRVGKYGLDLSFLEQVAIPGLYAAAQVGRLVVVDEIGPMECLSASFRQAVLDLLSGSSDLLGTIVQRSHPFADQVKKHPQVEIIEVRLDNREALIEWLCHRLEYSC
jgi:nucleoside-triphosphatase